VTRRLCCKRRRTAGAPDFTTTAPVEVDLAELAEQLAELVETDGRYLAAVHRISARPLPVRRTLLGRFRCWIEAGHLFLPGEAGCFDCGYRPRRGGPRRRR
jgi:hypothetical protein